MKPSIKANIARFESRPGRLIMINGIKWKWEVGRQSTTAYSELGLALVCHNWKIKGCQHPDDFEEGIWNRNDRAGITPKDVRAWIVSSLVRGA